MGKGKSGKSGTVKFYRGIEHFERPEVVEPWKADEFPDRESLKAGVDRRDVLKMIGGAALLAGMGGCRFQPARKIVPFVHQPEGAVAGVRKHYASAAIKDGYALGILVDQVDGRPIRIDGNPQHPSTLGSLDSPTIAEILNFYDPDRLSAPRYLNTPVTWNSALMRFEEALRTSRAGAGFAVLSEGISSPSVAEAATRLQAKYPGMRWFQYEPCNRDNEREGSMLAFGQDLVAIHDLSRADVVVSIDSDLLCRGPWAIRNSRDLAKRRKFDAEGGMNRVYAFESHPTTLGVNADHRRRIKPSETLALVKAIASRLGLGGESELPAGVDAKTVDAVVADVRRAGPNAVFACGDHLPREVQAAVMLLNQGIASAAVSYRPNPKPMPTNHGQALADFLTAAKAGQISFLLILGGNPAYTAPGDSEFAEALKAIPLKAHLSTHPTETGALVEYELPMSHFLESWGDGIALDGSVVVGQPIIEPLYDSKSSLAFLDLLAGGDGDTRAMVRNTFYRTSGIKPPAAGQEDQAWNDVLALGFYSGAKAEGAVNPQGNAVFDMPATPATGMELLILPDPMILDGRNANNMWMQETPRPITNLTWDNALLVSKATADRLGIVAPYDKRMLGVPFYGKADMVEVTVGNAKLEVPVWVNLGQADDVLVLHMGYGRTRSGDFGTVRGEVSGGGFNANVLRTAANPMWVSGVQVKKIDREYVLANVQHHNTIDVHEEDTDREVLRETTLAAMLAGKPFAIAEGHGEHQDSSLETTSQSADEAGHHVDDFNEFGNQDGISMYPGFDYEDWPKDNYQWAMTIDLTKCTGCNACVTACQSENNIPVVGKREVQRGREMHWIRVDRYYKGTGDSLDRDNPPIYFQPVTCMHCEQAPCEPVCPVAATTHSREGLNQMVYNRCVGTRYCSNNCPYKVRRFNFFHFSQRADNVPVLKMLQNPDVTVRFRGVMEKCTYCVQRINHARINAKKENRLIEDGEVKTACQVACPSEAIIFGDMRNPKNVVAQSRAQAHNYLMLEELNTRPRTSYLCRVRNPHPELEQ